MIGFLQAFVPKWLAAAAITGAFGWLVGVLGLLCSGFHGARSMWRHQAFAFISNPPIQRTLQSSTIGCPTTTPSAMLPSWARIANTRCRNARDVARCERRSKRR